MFLIASEQVFLDLRQRKETLTYTKFGNVFIACEGNYIIKEKEEGFLVYLGRGIEFNHKILSKNYEDLKKDLSASDESFTLALIRKNSEVFCCRSIYRHTDVYYWNEGSEFIVTTDLRMITPIIKYKSITKNFLSSYINNDASATFMSPISNVEKLEGGCELNFRDSRYSTCVFSEIKASNKNYIDSMFNHIEKICINKNVMLHYSGGLDSTLILLILKELGIKFTALHYSNYGFENDSETKHVSRICDRYNVRLVTVTPKLVYKNKVCTESHPMDSSAFSTEISGDNFSYDRLDSDTLILDGHGGDTLFVQNPSEKIGFQLFKRGKLLKAYAKMSDLSMLKNKNIIEMLLFNAKLSLRLVGVNNAINHPLIAGLDNRTASYDHKFGLIHMMEKMPLAATRNYHHFSPILSKTSIESFLSYDYETNFSDEYDRLKLRNILYNRFYESAIFEKKKRSSVNTIFEMIKTQKNLMEQIINDTNFIQIANLDKKNLLDTLASNSTAKIDNHSIRLLRLVDAYRFYHSLSMV